MLWTPPPCTPLFQNPGENTDASVVRLYLWSQGLIRSQHCWQAYGLGSGSGDTVQQKQLLAIGCFEYNIFVNRQDEKEIQANSSLLDCVYVVNDACAHMCVRITSAVD